MRLICPHCMSGVTVPDDAAGKEATCPNCGKSFPTPARYSAAVVPDASQPVAGSVEPARSTPHPEPAPAAPPPGYVPTPPPPPGSGFLPPPTARETAPEGYTHARGVTISPRVFGVLPAIFLTLALVFTFFPWVGSYLGGYPIYSQGPWRAVVGGTNPNRGLEAVAPPGMVGWAEKEHMPSDWLVMVPFLLCLLFAALLALADRGFPPTGPQSVPPLARIWPVRHTVIAALAVAALALVVIQSLYGFGLERRARQVVRENPTLVAEREAAQGSQWKLAAVENKEEQELAKLNLGRTIWMHLAVTCIVLGTMATLVQMLLERRGNKPAPRLVLHY